MKIRVSIFLMSIMALCSLTATAQPRATQAACDNVAILQQVDSLKKLFDKEGFIVVKEAPMNMETEYEIPVIVPLREGTWYRIIFIGDMSSKLYEVRMFDWNEKQVAYEKKMWGDVDGNIINYDYIPKFTEYHVVKPVQVNKKKKNVCGYIMIFKKIVKP